MRKLIAVLLSFVFAATALADATAMLDTDGTPLLMSKPNYPLNIGTQGTGALNIFTNNTKVAYFDGTTGAFTASGTGGVADTVETLAATGSSQGTSAALSKGVTYGTACDGTKGFLLPTGVIGRDYVVINTVTTAGATCPVYPPTSGTINALSANAAYKISPNARGVFTKVSSTGWYAHQLVDVNALTQVTNVLPMIDGDTSTGNLGSTSYGYKNIYFSDATNRSSINQSSGLYINYPTGQGLFIREASTQKLALAATTGDATFAGKVISGGDVTMAAGILNVGSNFETVAGAGTTVSDAGALSATKMFHQVTGANGTVGVKFATAAAAGQVHYILNTTAGILKVYAASGGTINGAAADAAFSALTGIKPILCVSTGANTWICS